MLTAEYVTSSAKARELRQAFDAAFAAPPPAAKTPTVALLLVRAGGGLLAVKRADVTGFVRGENIALTPGRSPAFLGLAGLRGGLYPVWSLARLLDRPAASAAAKWLVLTEPRGGIPCAFACEAFEKMIFVPETAMIAPARPDALAMAPWDSGLVPVVDLPALHADILKRKESI